MTYDLLLLAREQVEFVLVRQKEMLELITEGSLLFQGFSPLSWTAMGDFQLDVLGISPGATRTSCGFQCTAGRETSKRGNPSSSLLNELVPLTKLDFLGKTQTKGSPSSNL